LSKCGLPGFENDNDPYRYPKPALKEINGIMKTRLENQSTDENHHLRSPSESPDSQKADAHLDNSDSGLGTDHHEYYR